MKPSKFFNLISLFLSLILISVFFILAIRYMPPDKKYTEYSHSILYLDKSFTDDEIDVVLDATLEWNKATGGRVNYDIIMLNSSNETIDFNRGILVNKLPADNIEILTLDFRNENITLGYFTNQGLMPHIAIVADRLDLDDYKTVVMHEIGHSLGLDHNEGDDGIGTLMYPTIELQSNYISETDIKNYCKLHHCKLKH